MVPSATRATCVEPGGISSTWWVTDTIARTAGSAARPDNVDTNDSRPAMSKLVREQPLGPADQRAGKLDPPAFPLAQDFQPAVGCHARPDPSAGVAHCRSGFASDTSYPLSVITFPHTAVWWLQDNRATTALPVTKQRNIVSG